ncbi:hypothetical protein DY000_02037401 [Brassica cretica]|uniref:ATP-dependent DNA helicase n=1 Tax=Brassica cretica TaxID=69181 RepID=A0ABQ7BK48_BRACR|nr:hypothetical protein DY000_02037401 [Brassica cretica]
MDPNPNVLRLNNMPSDMLSLIVAKVGVASPVDYVNVSLSCKELNIGFENFLVAKDLNLQPLIHKPRRAKYYKGLMESCLKRDNVDAHYLWKHCEIFLLSQNMRIQAEEKDFADWILQVGDGIAAKEPQMQSTCDTPEDQIFIDDRILLPIVTTRKNPRSIDNGMMRRGL